MPSITSVVTPAPNLEWERRDYDTAFGTYTKNVGALTADIVSAVSKTADRVASAARGASQWGVASEYSKRSDEFRQRAEQLAKLEEEQVQKVRRLIEVGTTTYPRMESDYHRIAKVPTAVAMLWLGEIAPLSVISRNSNSGILVGNRRRWTNTLAVIIDSTPESVSALWMENGQIWLIRREQS